MTTIVFDGKTCAADSRRTAGTLHTDGVVKLVQLEDVYYKGEKVSIWAGAGSVYLLNRYLTTFVDNPDGFVKKFREARNVVGPPNGRASFIFITEKRCYTFSPSGDRGGVITGDEVGPDKKVKVVSIGSGQAYAGSLVYLFSLPAVLAVAAAGLAEEGSKSGGGVTYASITNGSVAGGGHFHFKSTQEILDRVKESIASPDAVYLGGHRNLTFRTMKAPKKEPEEIAAEAAPIKKVSATKKATGKKKKSG